MNTVFRYDAPAKNTAPLPAKPAQQHRDTTPAAGSGAAARAAYLAQRYGAPTGSAAEARKGFLARRLGQ